MPRAKVEIYEHKKRFKIQCPHDDCKKWRWVGYQFNRLINNKQKTGQCKPCSLKHMPKYDNNKKKE